MRYFVFQAPVTGEITAKVLCEDTDDLTADGGIEVTREDFDAVRLPEPPAAPDPGPSQMDRLEAQVTYTALKTGTLIGGGQA